MSKKIRELLYPFSLLYKGITKVRNKLYDKEVLKSNEFDIPLIVVGNLRVGGTGKTPQVAYLVALLKDNYKVAVLSRGYKRNTRGFVLANNTATAKTIGDEAFQLLRQHPDIFVAVDGDRTRGINMLLALEEPPKVIILDDAFQHRKVKAGFNILLTPYHDLYTEDKLLPAGNLRESITGAGRAKVLIVSKSPKELTEKQEYETAIKLNPSLEQTVFFTHILYDNIIQNDKDKIKLSELKEYEIILLTGIANPAPMLNFLKENNITYQHLSFADHHNYTDIDIQNIKKQYNSISNKKKLLLTTEKDYVRIFERLDTLYYLGIQTKFTNHQSDFDKLILDYVGENSRNR